MKKLACWAVFTFVVVALGCGGAGGGGNDASMGDVPDGYIVPDGIWNPELPPSTTMPVFDPTLDEFWSVPFPSDLYRAADGTLDLGDFPNPNAVPVLEYILMVAEEVLDGFSVVPVVYFTFSDALDTSGLPKGYVPAGEYQPIQIVDVTDGPDHGTRVPVTWEFRGEEGMYLTANTLMIRPLWGFTLKEGHTYAAFATSGLPGADGNPIEPAPYFVDALEGTIDGADDLVESLAPLKGLIEESPGLVDNVITGTVFTVGNPSWELRRIRDYLWEESAPPVMDDIETAMASFSYYKYLGHYTAPNFLKGEVPYDEEGGFEFNGSQDPVVQFNETMRFMLTVPKKMDMPADGWPIVIYSHGTGGNYGSFEDNPGPMLAKEGLAVIGIDQPLHGDRSDLPKETLELYSFNFMNVEAGRTVQRQSIPDNISLIRMIEAGNLIVPADVSKSGSEEWFDPDGIMFFGHSQGGLTGGMLFGVEDRFLGGVLSGAGGGMCMTLMERKVPMDIAVFMQTALEITDPWELTVYHPVINLLQMLVDATDPIAYAPSWFDFDADDPDASPRNVMMTEGLLDTQTPASTAEAMAATAGIPVLTPYANNPPGLQAKGIDPVSLPVKGNIDAGGGATATGFLVQYPEYGHYPVFSDKTTAQALYREFLHSLGYEGEAVVSE